MPRVKIDYIVSFSSEDPDNQANNLLSSEVNKRRWLCPSGEPSCSVVLQLASSVQISAVHVGAHHAALVEVLVGRSETPNEPFQVLVPSCVFVGPTESRREVAIDRVRSFSADQLAPAAGQRWDRLRLVCSQPYNKHCKYGLSFVHVYSPEPARAPPAAAPATPARRRSSDEESYRPGQLFATTTTGAQIRQATSHVLKNITDSSTKLVKTPIAKPRTKQTSDDDEPTSSDRRRDGLVYTADDERPHDKIDRVLHRHRQDKDRDKRNKDKHERDVNRTSDKQSREHKQKRDSGTMKQRGELERRNDNSRDRAGHGARADDDTKRAADDDMTRGAARRGRAEKRARTTDEHDECLLRPGPVRSAPHSLLAGVGVVLSGYQNPARAQHRSTALALGARVLPAWGAGATHLVCAFPNTPKLREVRAAPGGAAVPAVLADWLQQTAARRRRLPWQWFATEPARRLPPPPGWQDRELSADDSDTDDEIERAMRGQKRARSESSAAEDGDSGETAPRGHTSGGDDGDDGEEDAPPLPELFAGRSFLVEEGAGGEGGALLTRYITAYGGLVLTGSVEENEEVDYVVCAGGGAGAGAGRRVRADWVWRCHAAGRRLPADHDH